MKKKLMITLLSFGFLLTGCQNSKEKGIKITDIENVQKTTFPSSYQSSGEHTSLNINSIEPEEAYFINGTANLMELDYEGIGRIFMPDDGTNQISEGDKLIYSNEKIKGVYKEMYTWGNATFAYQTNEAYELFTSISSSKKIQEYNLSEYEEKKDFSFGSEEEVFGKIMDSLEELGIRLGENYKVDTYYLDYETLREQERHYDIDGNKQEERYKTDWSEEDNAYLFYIHQTYCGIEDYHNGDFWKGKTEDANAQIQVIYDAGGIQYLSVKNLSNYSMGSWQEELLDFDTIADGVIMHFDSILDDADYEITTAQLICDYETPNAESGSSIIPAWAFHVNVTQEGDLPSTYELRVNALTGEIMEN